MEDLLLFLLPSDSSAWVCSMVFTRLSDPGTISYSCTVLQTLPVVWDSCLSGHQRWIGKPLLLSSVSAPWDAAPSSAFCISVSSMAYCDYLNVRMSIEASCFFENQKFCSDVFIMFSCFRKQAIKFDFLFFVCYLKLSLFQKI